MASCIEWHLPVQEEADWLRLLLLENKYRKVHLTSLAPLYHMPTNPGSTRPQY